MNDNKMNAFAEVAPHDGQAILPIGNDVNDYSTSITCSNDSETISKPNTGIGEILSNNRSANMAYASAVRIESTDENENATSADESFILSLNDRTQAAIPKAVYHYAAIVRQKFETPRQNKLDHDVVTVLGSSDPPPGFGFLHPLFYHLEQTRPVPLEPLQVWRGYNGHVYFSPIQVRHFEGQRSTSIDVSQTTEARSLPSVRKPKIQPANTIISEFQDRNISLQSNPRIFGQIGHETRSKYGRQQKSTRELNEKLDYSTNEIKYPRSLPNIVNEELKEKPTKMWQSVISCAHIQTKPMSKRSRHAIEDLQTCQQEQAAQDPTGYSRQVLPNIRPVPKSKFIYKGLAYKETQKLPGIVHGNSVDRDTNPLQKPLIAYNLAQAYARYEINAARVKQGTRQPPPTAATAAVIKDQPNSLQTSLDLREMRKRIVRGTTLAYRPPPQSIAWTPGRVDHRSQLASETTYRRPSTSKSSIPQKQTTVHDMPLLTKNINQQRSPSRFTPGSEMIATTS